MKILAWDEKRGVMKLRVENQDDLWLLYNIIDEGDIVYAKTSREIKVGERSARKPMILGIRVKKLEFQSFTERLRINGIIIEEPEKYEERGFRGSHHTINLDIGKEIVIIKENWSKQTIKRINEACKKTKMKTMILSIDDEEVAVAILRDYGVEILFEMALRLPGKREAQRREEKMMKKLSEIANKIKELVKQTSIETLVISGPSYMREKIAERIKKIFASEKLKPRIYEENTSNGGVRGIYETLRREAIMKALSEYGIIEEAKLISELLELLIKNEGKVAFGIDEIEKMAKMGAIEKLYVIDEILHSYGEIRLKIEKIMREVEAKRGKIKIFSSIHEPGKQLKSLGGMAAILRYKLKNLS